MSSEQAEYIVLLSIRPAHAQAILDGTKKVEFRKTRLRRPFRFILLYAISPIQKVVGFCQVSEVQEASPATLWRRFAKEAGVTRDQFFEYFNGNQLAQGLILESPKALEKPLSLSQVCKGIKAPQSFLYLPALNPVFLQERCLERQDIKGLTGRKDVR